MQTRAIIIATIALTLAACGTTSTEKQKEEKEKQVRIAMHEIADEINGAVQGAAVRITRMSDDRDVKRLMLVWQIRTMETTRRAMQLPDLRWAYLDLWTMIFQSRAYLQSGETRNLPEDQRAIAIETFGDLLKMMEQRALRAADEEQVRPVLQAAREWAEANPIEGNAMNRPARPSPARSSSGLISSITSLPGDIFSIGGGVKETGQSISEVAEAADRAVDVVEALPISVRWQTELLLMDLEQNDRVARVLDDYSRIADTVEQLGKTVEDYPNKVEAMLKATIREAESTQPEFRKTVSEARGTVDGVNDAVDKVKETILDVERTTEKLNPALVHLDQAGEAWEGAFGQLNLVVNPPKDPNEPPSEPAPPLDMKDIRDAAKHLTSAGQEIRGAVVEVRAVIEGDGIDQRLKQVDETTEATIAKASLSVGELIDRLTWRAVIVILVFFGAMLGYRVVASRIPRRG